MANDPTVYGLILVKINGIYELDVKSGGYSAKQTVTQHVTGGGVKTALGVTMPSGSLEEVVPRQGARNWKTLKNFSMEWVDKETKKTVALFEGCNWEGVDGRMDLSQASYTKSISWKGENGVTF
jgi:hypothetical protein